MFKMGEKALSTYTLSDYREMEARAETKHEFHDGYISAMAGGTPEHSLISMNVGRSIGNELQLKGKLCFVYGSDARIHISATQRIYYPDVSVVCGKTEKSEQDPQAIVNPILIVEVLSESTSAFDRGAKFTHYRQISTLREYVLLSQTEAMVDTFYRTEDGTWEIHSIIEISDRLHLKSIDCEISMADIYRLVPGIDPKVEM